MKLGVLLLGRKRPGFDPQWGKHIEGCVKTALARVPCEVLYADHPAVDDPSLCAAVAQLQRAGAEALTLLQPTMSDGRLAPRLGQLWPDPVLIWATPENPDSNKVSSCSLVGAHVFAANLRQLKRPFELVYGMPGAPETERELMLAVRAAHAYRGLRRGKIGLIGYHAPGFIDMHADPFALSAQFGLQLYHTGVQELLDRAQAIPETDARNDAAAVAALGMPMDKVDTADLFTASRFYLAMKQFAAEEGLDALALREWPELPNLSGQWPYLAISRLLNDGFPVACEGDVDGAVASLMGCLIGCGPGYLTDWLAHDAHSITLWHGGCAPFSMCDPIGSPGGPRIARHFNTDKPAVVNARLTPGAALTLCRLWRCDNTYHMLVQEAESIEPERMLEGTTGAVRVAGRDVREWFRDLCHAGMPHHLLALPGNQTEVLKRLARLLGIAVIA